MVIAVSLISSAASDWLYAQLPPRRLHAFPNALNLINADGEILSLVNPQLGPGPFAAVLGEAVAFQPDERVGFVSGNLVIGNWVIQTSHAKTWNPRPRWELLIPGNLAWAEPILADELLHSEIHPSITNYQLPLHQAAASMKIFAASLAGRGPGLTPSGDDFLMGWMHALWSRLPEEKASRLCALIGGEAVPRTTTLSGAWLAAAQTGEAGAPWHALFSAFLQNDEAAVRRAARAILAAGHTSGADAVAGFIAGIK